MQLFEKLAQELISKFDIGDALSCLFHVEETTLSKENNEPHDHQKYRLLKLAVPQTLSEQQIWHIKFLRRYHWTLTPVLETRKLKSNPFLDNVAADKCIHSDFLPEYDKTTLPAFFWNHAHKFLKEKSPYHIQTCSLLLRQ